MAKREQDVTQNKVRLAGLVSEESRESQPTTSPAPDSGPMDHVACRAGDESCAKAHASTLNRATSSSPSHTEQSLLQLQKQYGNRYVQRVLALARKGEGEGEVAPEVETAIDNSRGGGQPLDTGTRGQMESAFGSDFSGVRVHTGSEPHELNKAVNAVAFTTGQDIFFRDGAYSPANAEGQKLLAHELTHVVQQGGAPPSSGVAQRHEIQRLCSECEKEEKKSIQAKLTVGQPDDPYEVEAERVAPAVVGILEKNSASQSAGVASGSETESASRHLATKLQRAIGDGHDLRSPRFAGDPVLEACFDNEALLQVGRRGPAVEKIQQALIDAGFPLPQFGVDGIFGPETQGAVRRYQSGHGLAPDGIVGPLTMGSLDALFAAPAPPGPVPVPPGPAPVPPGPAPVPPGPAPVPPGPAPVPPGPAPVPPGPAPVPPGPAPVPPGPAPVPPGPAPVPPGPAPVPAPSLTNDLQALVNAHDSAYANYKAKIVAASVADRTAALGNPALLRSIQGQLSLSEFAKVVELLGRLAPTAGTMLGDATVTAAMRAAFTASSPAVTLPAHDPSQPDGPCNPPAGTPPPAGVHEEGGWIYMNLITGALDTRRATAGGQANLNLGGPPDVADSIVVGTFHTHPNVGPCWGNVFPSGTDTNSANNTGVPWLIFGAFPDVATTQTTSTGPGQRLHLAGNRGFPGAAGGDAPQATIDGKHDEV